METKYDTTLETNIEERSNYIERHCLFDSGRPDWCLNHHKFNCKVQMIINHIDKSLGKNFGG